MMMLRSLAPVVLLWTAAFAVKTPGPPEAPEAPLVTSARPLPFFYDLYTFRNDDGGTDVVLSIAVEARRLRRERIQGQSQYRFDVRFVLADTAVGSVSNTEDSVYLRMPMPLTPRHLLHTFVEVQAQPSQATLQRVVVTDATRPGTGQLYSSPFPIPDYSGSELMLSDIAFGLPDATGGWNRGGITLALLPTSQFPESSFDVYYEIYNLPTGTPYETEISIQPLDGDDNGAVTAVFSGESSSDESGFLAELRRIQSAIPRGEYRFTVSVRDRIGGEVARQSRDFEVRNWSGGATLVEAMPYKVEG
jgi:hypothetical protein